MTFFKILRFGSQNNLVFAHHFRTFSISVSKSKAFVHNVSIIGAGHMGTGIGQNAGIVGCNVIIADTSQQSLDNSKKRITDRLLKVNRRKLKGKPEDEINSIVNSVLKQIKWTTDIYEAVSNCDLIIEAIPERIELKHKLLVEIDKIAPPETIFTTNTSSLPIHEIAQPLSVERKNNFGGTHFFDRDVKLVEVIRIPETTNEVYHKIREWLTFIGKVPVECKDTPGFIVNRLNLPYFLNAIRLYERGDAEIKDIDLAMKLGAGYPFGPFELSDHIGLDVIHDIVQGWTHRFPEDETYKCPEILVPLNQEGKLGRKSGEGFYKYK